MTTLDASTKDGIILVAFVYGDENARTYARFTDYTIDVPFGDGTYVSEPKMKVTLPPNTAGFQEQPCKIELPLNGFSSIYSDGSVRAPCEVIVYEKTTSSNDVMTQVLFVGRVGRTVRNFEGRKDVVLIECNGPKSEMDNPLGISTTHHCSHIPGDPFTCKVNFTSMIENGFVSAIDGSVVTITGLGAHVGRYWHRGWVQFDGLRLSIRDWDPVFPTQFKMVCEPPSTWLNHTVRVQVGDDKTIETCRSRFNNEENFGGAGYAMPAYSPNFETL